MGRGKLIFIVGGARSGKSSFAEQLAASISEDVTYIATAETLDDEMFRRVVIHRFARPQNWRTIEESTYLVNTVKEWGSKTDVLLIDCLTLWLSNLLLDENRLKSSIPWAKKESFIINEVKRLAEVTGEVEATVIIVANEVSLGIVPDNRIGRAFRDVAGVANQIIAKAADEVYLTVAGLPIEIKSLAAKKLNL